MGMSANVLSIQAIEDLKTALARFSGEAQEALNAAQLEMRRTLDWLAERLQYWQDELRRRQQLLAQAKAALARCRASGARDPKTGAYHEPNCTADWEAVRQAETYLRQAEAELRTVQHWKQAVEQAAADYGRQAGRLATQLSQELPRASALLGRNIAMLHSYVLMSAPRSAPAPAAPTSTTPSTQAAAETLAAAIGLAAVAPGLVGVAIRAMRQYDASVRRALGAEGERLATRLLQEEFAWQEIPFDQPHHGFDRVFKAPGIPIIVMESKVTRTGQFQPGQTTTGEQGSPEWIAHHADRMADPSSAEWSPKNEQIAAVVHSLGPQNVPVVSVVINSDTELVDIYYRTVGGDWRPLQEGVHLEEVLTSE